MELFGYFSNYSGNFRTIYGTITSVENSRTTDGTINLTIVLEWNYSWNYFRFFHEKLDYLNSRTTDGTIWGTKIDLFVQKIDLYLKSDLKILPYRQHLVL